MTKIPDKRRYKDAWEHHIKELASLALAADIPYNKWKEIRDELNNWLTNATNNLYTESENGK